MKKFISLTALVLFVSCGGPDNGGDADTDGVGSTEHRIFITSTTTDGAMSAATSGSTGIEKADSICAARAQEANLTRTYKAVISTFDSKANERLIITGAIYVVAGSVKTEIADSSASLWTASTTNLSNPINRDEDGVYLTGQTTWTGTTEEGNGSDNDCTDWTNTGSTGDYGTNDSLDATWIESGSSDSCSNSKHLYCISQ